MDDPIVTAEVIAEARALADATLTDTITVEVRDRTPTRDELGTETYGWTQVYAGPGLVQTATSREQAAVDPAGRDATVTRYILKAPVALTLTDGDAYRVTVTASEAPANLGRYRVTGWETGGWEILRRMLGVRDHG